MPLLEEGWEGEQFVVWVLRARTKISAASFHPPGMLCSDVNSFHTYPRMAQSPQLSLEQADAIVSISSLGKGPCFGQCKGSINASDQIEVQSQRMAKPSSWKREPATEKVL